MNRYVLIISGFRNLSVYTLVNFLGMYLIVDCCILM